MHSDRAARTSLCGGSGCFVVVGKFFKKLLKNLLARCTSVALHELESGESLDFRAFLRVDNLPFNQVVSGSSPEWLKKRKYPESLGN